MEDKRDILYNNLIKSGKVTPDQIGNIDEFKNAVKDESSARIFHKNLLGAGFSQEELGSDDDFFSSIAADFNPSEYQLKMPDTFEIGGKSFSKDKLLKPVSDVAIAPTDAIEINPIKPASPIPVSVDPGKVYNEMEEKVLDSSFKPLPADSYENIRENYFSRFSLTEEGKQAQADIAETQKDFTDILFARMKGSQEYKDIMSSTAAPGDKDTAIQALWEQDYQPVLDKQIQPFINEYSQKVLSRYAGPMNEDVHKLDKATVRNSWESISGRVTEYEAELDKRKGGWKNVGAPTFESNVARIQREANSKDLNERKRQVDAAKSMMESSQKMIAAADAESGSNFFEGMGRGLADEAFNIDNWTMGLKGLADGQACLGVLEKCEKDGPDSLTKEEQLLMDAMVSNAATQAYFQSELGRGYKAGSVTGASLPFMVDMLTGVAAVSAGTKAASKGLMKWIAKNYTKSAIQKNIAKGVTGLTKGVVDSAIHTASFGMGRVANDYTQREIGNVQFDMDAQGNLQYDGREGAESGAGTAAKAAFSTGIETQSELIGEQFAPVVKFVGKQIMKLPGLKNIPASGFGKFMKDMYGSASVESVREFAKSAQFQGPIAEYAEEVYNNLGSVAIGDMTPEQLVDIDQNIDTFLGVGVMSAAFGLVGTGAFIREKYKTGKEIRDFERKMHEHIDFDRLKSDLQGQDIEGARDFVKQVMADKSLSLEEKKEEIKYIANVLKESAMSSAEVELGKESLPADEIEGNKATIYSEFETARKNMESALSPDIVGRIDAGEDINPIMLYSGLSEQQQDAIIDYQAARNDFDDYLSNVRDKIAEAKESARQEVEGVSNPDMGAVVRVNSNLSPDPIHIVGGTLAFDEDGFVDEGKSSETIFYIDENGKRKMAAPSAFVSLIDMNDTESVVGQAEADAEAQVVAEEQMQLPQRYVPVVGDEVTTQDGIRGTVIRFTPEGDAIVSDEEKDYVVPLNSIISQNETKNGTFSLDEENKLLENEVQSQDEGLIPTVQEDPTSPVSNESASMEDKPVAVSPIPVDDKGNPMYHKAKIEDTISDLMDGSLDDNEIDEFVSANRKEAMDNLAKLEKKFPKMGTNKAKYLQDKAVHKSKMEEEQQRIAYWNSVEKEIKSLREKPGDAVAEEILSMEEPVNGEELAAQALSNGNIRLLQSSFADETGFGKDEAKKYFGLFASSENGGMTIQEAGESLMQADRENGTNFFDQNDSNAGRDAIINVLSQARSRGDLANIIKNNRRDMAERERVAEYAAYEQWCQDNFHMTPKEYEAYEEMAVSLLLEKYKGVDINVLFNKIDDNYNGRQEEGVAGSDAVLQGEGVIPSGRTGTGEDERGMVETGVQGSGTDGTVQEGTPTGEIINNVLNDAQNTLNSVAEERAKVNTSPTDAQKEAGNYKKGHIRLDGYDISIENPKGSERSGVDTNGQKWSVSMNNDYGYIRGTKAVDGDHIDIFLSDFPEQGNVFVIDQLNEKGEFDESKVMYGFASLEDARAAYLSNYSPSWESRIGAITEVAKNEFKKWIDSSVRKTKPFSEYKSVDINNRHRKRRGFLKLDQKNTFQEDAVQEDAVDSRFKEEKEKFSRENPKFNEYAAVLQSSNTVHEAIAEFKSRAKKERDIANDWRSRKYKKNDAVIEGTNRFSAGDDYVTTINAANERRRNNRIREAEKRAIEIEGFIDTLKERTGYQEYRGNQNERRISYLSILDDIGKQMGVEMDASITENDAEKRIKGVVDAINKYRAGKLTDEEFEDIMPDGLTYEEMYALKRTLEKHGLIEGDTTDSVSIQENSGEVTSDSATVQENSNETENNLPKNESVAKDTKQKVDKKRAAQIKKARYELMDARRELSMAQSNPLYSEEERNIKQERFDEAKKAFHDLFDEVQDDIPVMTEEEYLDSKGYGFSGIGEVALHKGKQKTRKQQDKIVENQNQKDAEYVAKREELRKEYISKLNNGELRQPSTIEKLIKVANGNPDNEATQAARRSLKKRGINWEQNSDLLFREGRTLSEEESIIEKAKANGAYMKSPNGKPTNLNNKQWVQVRTKAFKEWFGDWENDPENSSKVVDENGEPLIVYHGSNSSEVFSVFDINKIGRNDWGLRGRGFYFSPNMNTAKSNTKGTDNVYSLFLNIRKPFDINSFKSKTDLAKTLGIKEEGIREGGAGYSITHPYVAEFTSQIKEKGFDGVICSKGENIFEIVTFEPIQIKSATDNIGIFDKANNDIRFREVDAEVVAFAQKYSLDEADVRKYAQSMKMKNLGGASYAFISIKRDVRLLNLDLSLGEFVKVFSPIKKELYEKFGDVDSLRDEYVQLEMEQRNMMEAARKRAEEEAETEKKRLEEFELMSDEEMDAAYFKAMEENNESRMRDIINESARRNGYVSADEFRMAHRAPSYDEEGIDKNMVDIAANKDQIRESLNEQLRMNRDQYKDESAAAINKALSAIDKGGKPTVTIYRAVPKLLKEGKVRNGDWVSLSESYVKVHGEHTLNGNYRIMQEEVPAENLYWDGNDINEWGYDDRSDYRYKDTKNNRKLNDLITRNDKGNIIPPSKRFNARKADPRFRIEDSVNQKFNEELSILTEENADKVTFNLGTPSDVLLSAGIANKPMKLYGNKVIKKMKKHGFNLSELENLPEAVANPIAVFDNLGREGNRSILTELKTDNGNFLVTIDLGESKDIDFNIVSSVFGKTDNKVVNWITKGYATYINKEKALDYLYYPAPIAETPKSQELSDITKIIENFENPTLEQGKIIAAVDEISESLHTPVRIVRDVNEITDKDSKAEQRKRKAKGWFDPATGEVVLILPNASSVKDARATLFHEIVGHHGLRKMFGKDFDAFLDNVYDNADEGIQDAINRRGGDKRVATEEYLAELAERGFEDENERSLWQKIKDAFIDMLRKAGVNLGFKLSDNELRYILWRSHENLRQENVLDMAKDVAKQYELKVGNYRFREDIETEPDGSREAYNNSLMGNKYKFQEAYQDSMLALKNLQDVIAKVSGKPIEAFENAYMAENQMSSKSTAEAEKYYNEYFEPLEKEIAKLVTAGVTYDQISDYMILKHGIERNIEFSVRDTIRNVEKKQGIDAAKQMRQDYDHDKAQLRQNLENGVFKEDEYLPKLEEIGRKYVSNIRDYSATRTLLGKLTGKELPDGIDENKRTETYIQFFEDEYGKNADVQVLANTAIKEFESQFDVYTFWEKIYAATRQPLRKSYNSGLMSKENYNHTNSMFRFYVPLRGWDETTAEDVYEYLVSETSPVNSVLKTAKGRKSIPDNPIPVIGNMAESTILQGNRNMMKQAFMSMVMNHPTDVATLKKAWYVIDPSSGEWIMSYPSISEKDTMEEIETKMQEHEKRMKELEEEGKATQQSKGLNINYRIGNAQAKEHIVTVKRNGKDYMIFINGNPRAAQAINGLTNPDIEKNPMIKALGTANRWLAANFTTRNPAFVLSNLSRDLIFAQSAVMVKESPEYAGKFFVNVPKAMKSIMRNLNGKGNPNEEIDRLFNEFIENGGETGYMTLTDVDKYKKNIKQDLERLTGKEGSAKKALRWSVDRLEDFNRWAEDVSRFTTYVTSRQMGRTITESINDAKEITVNFNKKGAGYKTGGFWGISAGLMRNLYLFFNAGVQSLMNFQRLAKGNPTKFGIMLGGFTTAGFIIPALVNQFLIGMLGGGDDDPYQDLPDWIRRNNLCLYCGGGKFVTIPLPIELRAFYGLGDMAYQYTTTKGQVKLTEMMYDITNQITELLPLNPLGNNGDIVSTVMPDALKPFWQINQNKDFTGKPIYKKTAFNELDPEFKRVYKGTSGWLVDASQFLNEISGGSDFRKGIVDVNPAKIEHLFESYFGGMGKTFNQTGKTLWYGSKSLISGEKDENLKLRNTPVANRFMSETDEQSAYAGINREYFKIVDEFEEIEHEVNGLSQKAALINPQYLKEYIELTHSAKFKKYGEFKKLKSKIDYAYALAKNVPDGELRKDIDKTILDLKRQVISIMDENGNSTTEKQ